MRTLVLDFDGVLSSYKSGWEDFPVISDPPVPGALEFCNEAVKYFYVCIHSSRCANESGKAAIAAWLQHYGFPLGKLHIVDKKPPAWLTIDDRCFLFTGQFPSIDEINNFKPWTSK